MPNKSWCDFCNGEMLRMYIRKQDLLGTRGFVSIGWFCSFCRLLDSQLDQNALIEGYRFNKYRIYVRDRDKGRKFIPFANYYPRYEMFWLDISEKESRERWRNMIVKTMPEALRKQLESIPKNS